MQGKVVYGNYGAPEDLGLLEANGIAVNGSVMLLRASTQISFAQQVGMAVGMSRHLAWLWASA